MEWANGFFFQKYKQLLHHRLAGEGSEASAMILIEGGVSCINTILN